MRLEGALSDILFSGAPTVLEAAEKKGLLLPQN
jgi:hypothetical protein